MKMVRFHKRMFAGLVALAMAGVPMGAFAQSAPSGLPSYAAPAGPAAPSDQETIHGQIASIDDPATLQISDDRGYTDSVQLQPGAVINPSGTQLQPGMTVTISGSARGAVFAAYQIDVAGALMPPQAQPPEGPPPMQQPAPGMQLTGSLGMDLDSKSAFVGEDVVLTNVSSPDGSIGGATLYGRVTDVTRPGGGHNAQVRIHFDSLRLPDGTRSPIDGIVMSMNVKPKNNTAKELGGALLGMIAGNAIGKTLFGVSGGGIVGAIGGFVIAKDSVSDVVIPENTAVTVRLVNARRQAS